MLHDASRLMTRCMAEGADGPPCPVQEWVKRYQQGRAEALADLLTMLVQVRTPCSFPPKGATGEQPQPSAVRAMQTCVHDHAGIIKD